ncbi:hypothetical protein OEIGOIKO_00680 [Streptomyces chrestomyceticus JCM 4735]|uniref:Ricin B lectin domain-containing protein n=1 Tax=Streptomyces chrestomyceticus JCM 4735 TaxID=1306181 RepID=A0A7U9PU88_9ACTN|nr:RICIN domain-containing protein [Streptomyces chrestomyceticus]GCD32962.1 hypothetical protein OEIGOIKO_00680 [Streptomyces chrestomyceticus JCM 4735]
MDDGAADPAGFIEFIEQTQLGGRFELAGAVQPDEALVGGSRWRGPLRYGAIQLQNRVSGKCLAATSTETVYAKNCDNGDSAQWWTEEYVSGGVVMLINQRNRMALDSDARGNAYLKSPGAGNTYQEWKVLQ